MFAIKKIRTCAQARAHLDEVTRHRLDLITNPPTARPTLAERKRDPKLGIVWLLMAKINRYIEEARQQGVDLADDGRLLGHRV